jgi:hypothetical protein
MNNLSNTNDQSDEETAHYVALNKMADEELHNGDLACINYLREYYRELGAEQPESPPMIGSILDSLPTIRSSPGVAQGLVELYQSSGLNVPVGLLDLPLYWAKAFHELIRETHWPACDACSIHDVFGWNLVIRYGGYLHIQFESPIPHQNSHWCDVGRFIVELHERFEPGLMTPASRLCEFS